MDAKQVQELVQERTSTTSSQRMLFAHRSAIDIAYYQNIQWMTTGGQFSPPYTNTSGRVMPLQVNYNPDMNRLRVTDNIVTRYVLASASATYPQGLSDCRVEPVPRDAGVSGTLLAQVEEDALAETIEASGLLRVAQYANFMRCVMGVFGIGLEVSLTPDRRLVVRGRETTSPDSVMRAFGFHPYRLLLDPAVTSTDLRGHDVVIYEDVWTINKLRRLFPGIAWDEDDMTNVGALAWNEVQINQIPGVNIFQQYAQYSNTKGAKVWQVHVREPGSDRYAQMFSCYSLARTPNEIVCVNADNPRTPFGGDGLGMVLLHAHYRPDSWISISDVSMMRDPQDKRNLAETWRHRQSQANSAWKVIVDQRAFGKDVSEDELRNRFNNQVGGLIAMHPRSSDRTIREPYILQTPQPQAYLNEMVAEYDDTARRNVFRNEQSMGEGLKTHTPASVYQQLNYEGDRVHGQRVDGDIQAYEKIMSVMLGTVVKGVHEGNPSTLAMLRRAKFDAEEIGVLLEVDPNYPACGIRIPESAVRYRSTVERRNALVQAVQTQAIDADRFRRGMAELDVPLDNEDAYMRAQIGKWVMAVVNGEEWQPIPLGDYTPWLLSQFRRAYGEKSVRYSRESKDRITRAILAQQQFEAEVQAATMAPQAMMEGAARGAATTQAQPEPAPEPPQTIGDMIDAMASGAAQ